MVIYPPNSSRAKFEQPKWAQDTTRDQQSRFETGEMEFETTPESSNATIEATAVNFNTELSQEAIEQANDRANVQYITEVTQAVCTWRQLALHQ